MKKGKLISIGVIVSLVGWVYFLVNFTDVFIKTNTYYSRFTKVSGLQQSGSVLLHGVKIGKVTDLFLDKDGTIHVTYAIKKDISIPESTVATIVSGDASGARSVSFMVGSGKKKLLPGSYIPTIPDTTIVELFNTKITPLMNGGKFLIHTADSTLFDINYLITSGGLGELAQKKVVLFNNNLSGVAKTITNATQTVNHLSKSINKLNHLLGNPSKTNQALNAKINSGINTTQQLSQQNFDSTLNRLNTTTQQFSDKLAKQNETNKLLNEKTAYQTTLKQIDTAHAAMKDFQNNPSGFQIIGSSKKKK
jgi:phospholipid/cholesterol/gamma-HCH transport system substrate-binding protein